MVAQRSDAHHEADKTFTHRAGRAHRLVRRAPERCPPIPRERRRRSPAPARTTSPNTSRASASCSSGTATTAASAHITSTGSPRTWRPISARPSTRWRRAEPTTSCLPSTPSSARVGRAGAALRSQQVAVLRPGGRRSTRVPPQPEPPALQEQPRAQAGGQLRRRSQGDRARGGALRGDHDRPVPAAGLGRLPGRAHLPAQGARPSKGSLARQGPDARRQGRPLHDRPGRGRRRRRRFSRRT